MTQDQLDYAAPNLPGRSGRTFSQWMILLGVWCVGLVIWTVYAVVIGYLFFKIA